MRSRVDLFVISAIFHVRESSVVHVHHSNLKLLELETLRRSNQLRTDFDQSGSSGSSGSSGLSGSSQVPAQTDSECLWGSGNPSSCRDAFLLPILALFTTPSSIPKVHFSLLPLTCSPNSPPQHPRKKLLPSLPSSGRKVRLFRWDQSSPNSLQTSQPPTM